MRRNVAVLTLAGLVFTGALGTLWGSATAQDVTKRREARSYQLRCGKGSIGGFASVPSNVDSDWVQVGGYGLVLAKGGPKPKPGTPPYRDCSTHKALARRLEVGTFKVSLARQGVCAGSGSPVAVTVNDSRPLVATTTGAGCGARGPVYIVYVRDLGGVPTDAAFTFTLLEPTFVPVP